MLAIICAQPAPAGQSAVSSPEAGEASCVDPSFNQDISRKASFTAESRHIQSACTPASFRCAAPGAADADERVLLEPCSSTYENIACATASSDRRSCFTKLRNVLPTMRKSSHSEALRMYQTSSASFSVAESRTPPLTWAQPVMPGRTASRSLEFGG